MTDTCPICHDSSAHKLGPYLQEFDLLSPSDHRIGPQGSMQLLLEASDKLGSSVKNDGLGHTMQT
jgi:hypothetical protein